MKHEPDPRLLSLFEETKSVPARDPKNAVRGRAMFLREASELRAGVSTMGKKRLMGWNMFNRKEKFAMNAFLAVVVTLVMLAGGGLTVYAAQDDLPNQPLYGVKTLSEDIGLALAPNSTARMERLLQLSQRRVDEMAGLVISGQPAPVRVASRLQQHIDAALQLAANQTDPTLQADLLRIRERLQLQERTLTQAEQQAGESKQPTLQQAREMIQQRIRVTEAGMADPQQFRNIYRHGYRFGQDTPTPTGTLPPEETPSPTLTAPGGYDPGPNGTPIMGTSTPNGNGAGGNGGTNNNGVGGGSGDGSGNGGSGGGSGNGNGGSGGGGKP